jgi:hypothetical protein
MIMKLPTELRDRVVALSVTEESILEIWTEFPGIKWYISGTKLDWERVSRKHTLSEEFIREFSDHVYWYWVSRDSELSEEFIREFSDHVYWYWVSRDSELSEEFIREFRDNVDWDCLPSFQALTEEFIIEFRDRINRASDPFRRFKTK